MAAKPTGTVGSLSGVDPSRLGPDTRRRALRRLGDETLDVLVIGGGITGVGCALDAATRGLDVGLIEQRDLASGTSSRSSKLIHGGLRYLERLDLRLVAEALHERTLLLHLAPHLVHPLPFLYPLRRHWERLYVGAGVLLYDLLAASGSNPLPRHRHLGRRSMLREFPDLDPEAFVGAIRYWDAQTDDARYVAVLARTAARHGASIAPSVRAVGLLRRGDRVVGVRAVDLERGAELEIRARVVVNATGVWTDDVEAMAGDTERLVIASKGIHLVVPGERIRGTTGLITRTEKSVLFVIPWDGHWLIGTTDTPWRLHRAHPAANRTDIEYLLDHVNRILARPLGARDLVGVYAGLRPLVAGDAAATEKLSREHVVTRPRPGLLTVAGGKFTTYRVMAADALDAAAGDLGRLPPSVTDRISLVGADGYAAVWNTRERIARERGLPVPVVERLLRRYGSLVGELFALIDDDPSLGEPLPGGAGHLRAELRHAVSHEGALHLDDLLTRRTHISIEEPDRGVTAAHAAAPLVADLLGWDARTVAREIEHYEARVAAELESQRMPDDRTADAARMGAPDVRVGLADD
ncbi:MAG TPA: glycerol-3-phosphate dehydrogenase/oxidase [Actinobacteria bacterium]|nr:glycerol-3-phosphate dehydrogenase/oxidase [Actinomycetota bacterium]